jgi:lipopolysaccharide export system permease protein
MNRLAQYTLTRFLGLLVLTLGCTVVVFLVVDYVEKTKSWFGKSTQEILSYYLNYIPNIVYLILPIALLLASVFSIGRMASQLEITAMRAAGFSVYRILSPILIFGVLLTIGMYYFSNTVLPDANYKRFRILEPKTAENKGGNTNSKYKFVYIGPDGTTFFLRRYYVSNKRGRGVALLMEKNGILKERYDAQVMTWKSDSTVWELRDGVHRVFTDTGIVAESFNKRELSQLQDTPEDLVNNRVFPDEMRLNMLQRRIDIMQRSGEDTSRFETQWHFRIAGCFVGFVTMLLGLSLSIHVVRAGLAKRVGLAVVMVIIYFVVLRLGVILGESGALSPFNGAWFGNYIFGSLSIWIFWRASRV